MDYECTICNWYIIRMRNPKRFHFFRIRPTMDHVKNLAWRPLFLFTCYTVYLHSITIFFLLSRPFFVRITYYSEKYLNFLILFLEMLWSTFKLKSATFFFISSNQLIGILLLWLIVTWSRSHKSYPFCLDATLKRID